MKQIHDSRIQLISDVPLFLVSCFLFVAGFAAPRRAGLPRPSNNKEHLYWKVEPHLTSAYSDQQQILPRLVCHLFAVSFKI